MIFLRILVQHRIRVVDVHIDFTWAAQMSQTSKASVRREDGNVSHLRGSLSAALHADKFIIAPEGTVEEQDIGSFEFIQQDVVNLGNRGHVGETFSGGGFDDQPERGFRRRELLSSSYRNVRGKVSSERKRATTQSGVFSCGSEQRKRRLGR